MQTKLNITVCCLLLALSLSYVATAQATPKPMHEMHRPQLHFSPKAHWVNDPNGMVYSAGVYHLFYQYYPQASIWGPMHWGHATSTDLVHWKELPIALYPDSLGYIFSGSAVLDKSNTSGFEKNGKAPLIAMYTNHSQEKADLKQNDFQTQSIAYSNDEGASWTKFASNPVIKNPGITDFRDPKLTWYAPQKKWIVTLATKDRITFYSSRNMKNWVKESEFGATLGAHGGVWECPDLFVMDHNGKQVWVLLVNLNPGGPNKGSATQYFLGNFDGHQFTSTQKMTKWVDFGADEYAGITWSNTGTRKIFIGWMSNWLYANEVPTTAWRNGMTVPRELGLKNINNELYLTSVPVKELTLLGGKTIVSNNIQPGKNWELGLPSGTKLPCRVELSSTNVRSFSMSMSNAKGEQVVVGYDHKSNQYYIDRSKSGKKDFNKDFAAKHFAPRFSLQPNMNLTLIIDVSSVELFADAGLTTMTDIFFPNEPYTKIEFESTGGILFNKVSYTPLKSIWP